MKNIDADDTSAALLLSEQLGFLVYRKGPVDEIAFAKGQLESWCSADASKKRVAGQGDVLAGIMAALLCLVERHAPSHSKPGLSFAACVTAGSVLRRASSCAYAQRDFSLLTSDILQHIFGAFTYHMEEAPPENQDDLSKTTV